RLRVLQAAGFDPDVVVSGVPEDIEESSIESLVRELAERKAEAVASRCPDSLVLGCDSMLEIEGRVRGKPKSEPEALEMWRSQTGRAGTLMTGHCLIDTSRGARRGAVARTVIRFGRPEDEELRAYVASGEPLGTAGGFTIEGRGAPFIEGIEGDPGNVLGLSVPVFRFLLRELGFSVTDLWGLTPR
ncbi:MAG TPA: nucleoside triphosphate pyrophosphatase, partial [Acidimicrobiales bacterium]|nr:nucleoside triphosphate pyrophosphatase [Acidimicrobiales bacterium]